MNPSNDEIISELEAVTAKMATLEDLSSEHFNELLERRGQLIMRLIGGKWDASDNRLASIIANAAQLQERLQKHAESVRSDLASLKTAGSLMALAKSTLPAPQPKGVDISA